MTTTYNRGVCVGGLDDTTHYSTSVLSLAKQNLIREIAQGFTDKMKLRGLDKSDAAEIVEAMKEQVPNPKKNKKQFSSDEARQKDACRALAIIINKQVGETVIDASSSPDEICAKVMDNLGSIFNSIASELYAVKADSERVQTNLEKLENIISRDHKQLLAVVNSTSVVDIIKADYSAVQSELKRHSDSLKSITLTLKPGIELTDNLEADLRQNRGMAKSITQSDGSRKYGAKIAYVLSCFSDVVSCAKAVDDVLRDVGSSHMQYVTVKQYTDLRDTLDKDVMSKCKKQLAEYEDAKQTLYKYQYLRSDAIDALDNKTGSSEDNVPVGGIELDKAVTQNRESKRALLRSFISSLATHFETMLVAADKIAKYVGEGRMKSSDDLEKFAQAIDMIPPIDKQYYYLALSGYDRTSTASEEREIFVSKLRYVVTTCSELSKHKDYSQFVEFKEIATSMDNLIKAVNDASSKFEKGFSTLDVHGSAEDLPSNIVRVGVELEKVKTIILYFTRVAKIKDGLQRSHKEVHAVREKYDKVLGDAIAERLEATQKEAKEFLDKFDTDPIMRHIFTGSGADVAKEKLKDAHKKFYSVKINMYKTAEAVDLYLASFTDALTAHPEELKSIMEMLNNVEIISKWFNNSSGDMLCHVFDSFPAAFEGNELHMSELVEKYPTYKSMHYYERVALICRLGDGDARNDGNMLKSKESNHTPAYIEMVGKLNGQANWAAGVDGTNSLISATKKAMSFPGNPFLGLPVFTSDEVKLFKTTEFRKLEDMLDKCLSVNILKNIISIFVNVADKFGGTKLSDKGIMTPIQIFKHLCEYIKYSAVTCGIDGHELAKDVNISGFNYVKDAVRRDNNNNAPVFNGETTYGANDPDGSKIRIGVSGSVLFSGSHRKMLSGLKEAVENLSGYSSQAEEQYKKAMASFGKLVSSAGGNALGEKIKRLQNQAGNAAVVGEVHINVQADMNADNLKYLTDTMKSIANCVINGARWFQNLAKVVDEVMYFSNANIVEKNKQLKKYLNDVLTSSNITDQIKRMDELFNKTGTTLNVDANWSQLSPQIILIYLMNPSSAGVGAAYAEANEYTGDNRDTYVKLVRTYLDNVCVRSILGTFHKMSADQVLRDADGKIGDTTFGTVGSIGDNSASGNGVIKSWHTADIISTLLSKLALNKNEDRKFGKEELLWKEVGSVAMRGVGTFKSKEKRKCDIAADSSKSLVSLYNDNYSPFKDIFVETDDLFMMCIKSIVAKILTAIGTFNMFHRQYNPDGAGYVSGLRTILGGDDFAGNVQIIDEALELYVRMPLLLEFYKKVMLIGTSEHKIAFIPEMNNIFGGLLNLIFVRNKDTKEGNYAESDIREIIKECNKIYVARKDKSITEIVNEFISEVNARYGVISTRDVEIYNEFMKKEGDTYESQYKDYDQIFDPSLSGLDENAVSKQKAPSDAFVSADVASKSIAGHKYKIDRAKRAALRSLRARVDNELKFEGDDNSLQFIRDQSMNKALAGSKEELRTALNNDEKYRIIRAAITGFTQSSLPVVDKAYMMLHEFVVTPMCVLDSVHTLVNQFNQNISIMSCISKAVLDWRKYCETKAGTVYKTADKGSIWFYIKDTHVKLFGNSPDYSDELYIPYLHGTSVGTVIPNAHNDADVNANVNGYNGRVIHTNDNARQGYNAAASMTIGGAGNSTLESLVAVDPTQAVASWKVARLDMITMCVFDLGRILTALFENLNSFAQNIENLIETSIDASYDKRGAVNMSIALTSNNLKEYVPSVISSVKKVINNLRSMIPQHELKKIENDWEYSVYKVENKFRELFKGDKNPQMRIDLINSKITQILKLLLHEFSTNMKAFAGAGVGANMFKAYTQGFGQAPDTIGPANKQAVLITNRHDYTDAGLTSWPYEYDREIYRLILWDPSCGMLYSNEGMMEPGVNVGDIDDVNGNRNADRWKAVVIPNVKQLYTSIDALDAGEGSFIHRDVSSINNIFKIAYVPDQATAPATSHLTRLDYFANSAGYAKALYDHKTGLRNDSRRSIVLDFNRLVALYLNVIFDPSAPRVYKNTIESFVNESFSHEIRGDKNINDLSTDNISPHTGNNTGGEWKSAHAINTTPLLHLSHEGVLCRSLATLFKILYTQTVKNKPDTHYYLESDLNNLPTFLKEKYRGGFPVLIRTFQHLIRRCELLKPFVYNLNVAQSTTTAENNNDIPTLFSVSDNLTFDECLQKSRQKLVFYLDEVITGSRSIIKCMETTLNELGYSPKYLELYKTYNADFKSSTGRDPITPLSSALRLVDTGSFGESINKLEGKPYDLLKINSSIEDFKYIYGIGILMTRKQVKFEDLPGLKIMTDSYNKAVDEKNKMTDDELLKLVNFTLSGLLYGADIVKLKMLLKSFDILNSVNNSKQQGMNSNPAAAIQFDLPVPPRSLVKFKVADKEKIPLQYTQSVQEVINIPNNVKAFMSTVINLVGSHTTEPTGRKALIAKNIADLNVVPINVHSLMREIPLVNLYNYSDTFDKMICNVLGDQTCLNVKEPLNSSHFKEDTSAGKKLLCHMMCDPYVEMDFNVYDAYFGRIMRGNLGVEGLGRPKYIADEIYNKPLFGEVIGNDEYKQEGGPAVSDAYEQAITRTYSEKNLEDLFVLMALASFGDTGYSSVALDEANHVGYGRGLLPATISGAAANNDVYAVLEGTRARVIGANADHIREYVELLLKNIWGRAGNTNIDANVVLASVNSLPDIAGHTIASKNVVTSSYTNNGAATRGLFFYEQGPTHGLSGNIARDQLAKYLEFLKQYLLVPSNGAAKFIEEYVREPHNPFAANPNDATIKNSVLGKLLHDFHKKLETKVDSDSDMQDTITYLNTIRANGDYNGPDPLFIVITATKLAPNKIKDMLVKNSFKGHNTVFNICETLNANYNLIGNNDGDIRFELIKIIKNMNKPDIFEAGPLKIDIGGGGGGLRSLVGQNNHNNVNNAIAALTPNDFNGNSNNNVNIHNVQAIANQYRDENNENDVIYKLFIAACADTANGTKDEVINNIITYLGGLFASANTAALRLQLQNDLLQQHISQVNPYYMHPQRSAINDNYNLNPKFGNVNLGSDNQNKILGNGNGNIFNNVLEQLKGIQLTGNKFNHNMANFYSGLVPKYVTPFLHWMQDNDVKKVYVGNHKYMLKYLGKMRFDTVLVRNLIWLANIQRLLRLKLRRDLTWYDDKIVSQHSVTASSITELHGNDTHDDVSTTRTKHNPFTY